MTKHIWTGICAAIVGFATAAVTAQTTPPQQSNASSSSAERRVTVTGCLKQAPASAGDTTGTGAAGTTGATGTTGAVGAAADASGPAPTFILTNAAASAADPSATAGAAGTTQTESAKEPTAESQTYRLIGNPSALSPHVGKKVELTGTIEDSSAAHRPEPSGESEAHAPALRVESGKIVAPSCTQ